MKKKTLIIAFLLCGLLCSCSSLQTELVSDSARSSKMQLPYYLPKGLITIDVSYKPKKRMVEKTTESCGPSGPVKITERKEENDPADNNWVADITASVTYVADESAPRLYAQYSNNIFSKDTIDIKTDKEGLLTTIEGRSEDKSLIVIENLSLAALEVGKVISGIPYKKAPSFAGKPRPEKLDEIHITVDPTDQAELNKANCELAKSGLKLIEGLRLDDSNKASYKTINISFDGDQKYSGLLFRPYRFYRLYQGKKLIESFAVPDPTQHYCVPLKRRAFVTSITKLEIENGMLKGVYIDKGSEAEAISGLPLRLLKAVASLPQGILIYQSDKIQAETNLIDAQTRQIKAIQDLEKARQGAQ